MTAQPELEHAFFSSSGFTTEKLPSTKQKNTPNPQTKTEGHKLHAARGVIFSTEVRKADNTQPRFLPRSSTEFLASVSLRDREGMVKYLQKER